MDGSKHHWTLDANINSQVLGLACSIILCSSRGATKSIRVRCLFYFLLSAVNNCNAALMPAGLAAHCWY